MINEVCPLSTMMAAPLLGYFSLIQREGTNAWRPCLFWEASEACS